MRLLPGAKILTNLKLILNMSASKKMIKRNKHYAKSQKRR
jgi:hypothetical protein